MLRKTTGALVALTALAGATGLQPAMAEPIELKFGDFQSPQHVISKEGSVYWMKGVEKAADGKVKFTYFPSQQAAKAKGILDAVKNGILDVGIVANLYHSDRLPLNSIAGLPGLGGSSVEGSRVLHKMTKGGLLKDEFLKEDVYPLFSVVMPPYQILTKSRKVETPDDWNGMKIRTGGTSQALTARALGGVGVSMPGPEVYTAVERGTVDGVFFPLSSVPGYNLQEVVRHISTNAAFGAFSLTIVINKEVFDGLPQDVREAMLKVSEDTARHLAQAQDSVIGELIPKWKAAGIDVFQFSDAQLRAIAKMTAPVQQEWVERVSKQNANAQAVLDTYMKILAEK